MTLRTRITMWPDVGPLAITIGTIHGGRTDGQ